MTIEATDPQAYVNALALEVESSIAVTELAIAGLLKMVKDIAELGSERAAPDDLTVWVGPDNPSHATGRTGRVALGILKAYAEPGDGSAKVLLSQQWLMSSYARWELHHRPTLGLLLGVPTERVMSDLYGDLRMLRNDVAHRGGMVGASTAARLKVLTRFVAGDVVGFDHDDYAKIRPAISVYANG